MTAAPLLEEPLLTADEWTAMLLEPVRDKRYLSTQLGGAVADYLSWKEHEDGAAARTVGQYEYDLARLAVRLAGRTPSEVTTDEIRSVRDTYPRGSAGRVTAAYKDFFRWLYEEGRIDHNPAGRLRYPKKDVAPLTHLFTDEEKAAIVTAQTSIRDRVCVLLLLRAGLRKGELRQLQVRDINLVEKYVLVTRSKSRKGRRVPIMGETVRALDEFLLTDIPGLGRPPRGDDHLLYPARGANQHGRGKDPAPDRPMADSTAHRWWYACLERAGIVDAGVTSGRRAHLTRHTYATDLGRATGWNMVAVQKSLGHARIGTTVDTYLQFAFEDVAEAVSTLPEIVPLDE